MEEGFGRTGAEHDVEELVRQAASCIQSRLGAKVENVSIPMHLDGKMMDAFVGSLLSARVLLIE